MRERKRERMDMREKRDRERIGMRGKRERQRERVCVCVNKTFSANRNFFILILINVTEHFLVWLVYAVIAQ